MTTDDIIKLVRDYGRERYRCGKANARLKNPKSEKGRVISAAAALRHAQKGNRIFRKIIDEISPYVAPR